MSFLKCCILYRLKLGKSAKLFGRFIQAVIMAPIMLSKIAAKLNSQSPEKSNKTWRYLIIFGGLYIGTILFLSLQSILDGCWAIGLFSYVCFCGCTAKLRMNARNILGIPGHPVEDFVCSLILYPSVAMQLEMTMNSSKESQNVALDHLNGVISA